MLVESYSCTYLNFLFLSSDFGVNKSSVYLYIYIYYYSVLLFPFKFDVIACQVVWWLHQGIDLHIASGTGVSLQERMYGNSTKSGMRTVLPSILTIDVLLITLTAWWSFDWS